MMAPAATPGRIRGSVTRRSVRTGPAPSVRDASGSDGRELGGRGGRRLHDDRDVPDEVGEREDRDRLGDRRSDSEGAGDRERLEEGEREDRAGDRDREHREGREGALRRRQRSGTPTTSQHGEDDVRDGRDRRVDEGPADRTGRSSPAWPDRSPERMRLGTSPRSARTVRSGGERLGPDPAPGLEREEDEREQREGSVTSTTSAASAGLARRAPGPVRRAPAELPSTPRRPPPPRSAGRRRRRRPMSTARRTASADAVAGSSVLRAEDRRRERR